MEKINEKDLLKIVEISNEEAEDVAGGGFDIDWYNKCMSKCESEDKKRNERCMDEPVGEFNSCIQDSLNKLNECRRSCL